MSDHAANVLYVFSEPLPEVLRIPPQLERPRTPGRRFTRTLTRAEVLKRLGVEPAHVLEAETTVLRAFEDFCETLPAQASTDLRRTLDALQRLPATTTLALLRDLDLTPERTADVVRLHRLAFALDVIGTHLTAHLPERAPLRLAHAAALRALRWLSLGLSADRHRERLETLRALLLFAIPHRDVAERLAPQAVVLASAPRHAPPVQSRSAHTAAA